MHTGRTAEIRGLAARPRVLVAGPNPPPMGGIVSVIRAIVEGPLAERFDFEWFGTTSRRAAPLRPPLRWLDSAVAVACGLGGIVQRETLLILRDFERRLDGGFDLAHLHASHGYDFMLAWVLAAAARRRGVPAILHTHGTYDKVVPGWSGLQRIAFRRALRTPDRVIVLSDGWRRWFSDWVDPARLAVLRNCVDAERFHPAEGRVRGRELRVLFVGVMDPRRKGAYDLLAWIPEMLARVPEARFVFVGTDVEKLEDRLVGGTPLAERVEFVGARGPGEIEPLFQEADLMLLPSYAEGLPIVLLEAMASGLPVIAAPVNGVPEALAVPAGGIFVPPGDRAGWVAAFAELAADPERRARMGRANRARCLEFFDVRPYSQALGALYDEVLGAGTEAVSAMLPGRPR